MIGREYTYDAKMFVDGWLSASPEGQTRKMSLIELGLFIVALCKKVTRRIDSIEDRYAS